jgi:hypothetical protein
MSAIGASGVGGPLGPVDDPSSEDDGATEADATPAQAPSRQPSSGDPFAILGSGVQVAAPSDSDATVAALEKAMAEEPAPALAQTLARAAADTPSAYRAALRSTLGQDLAGMTDLQKHLSMIDEDGDGKVSIKDNYDTLRDLKFSPLKAAAVAAASQIALDIATKSTDGSFKVANATDTARHQAVDTGAMGVSADVSAKIDEMMSHDGGKGYLTFADMSRYIDERAAQSSANPVAKTLTGAANKAEFQALFQLAGGKLTRDDLQDFYGGSFFYSLLPPDALAQRLVNLRKS